jgi:hypothetical protein
LDICTKNEKRNNRANMMRKLKEFREGKNMAAVALKTTVSI